jgi:hypothetical protein
MTGRASHVFRVAESLRGEREQGGNNRGPFVERLFRGHRTRGNWCAAFVAYCFEESGACPIMPDRRRRGAKALVKYVAKEFNGWVYQPRWTGAVELREILPGDVIAWHRFGWEDWRGHVELVKSYDPVTDKLTTYAGNVGRYPASPKIRTYRAGSWRRRMYGVSRLLR